MRLSGPSILRYRASFSCISAVGQIRSTKRIRWAATLLSYNWCVIYQISA
jgi:hypothetical protein